ncbi:hypothetical protein [Actinacidiphila oryziradicis]|uniref:Uncharacterized protein n=1 Tax=Actinacidiphila oryziradicis TaxID=2571141 RepID=A0A4U0RZ10_9ACTN|nr:hypothetical protein FCI23_40300 [Actinacidiphila oryziradicis]
MRPAGSPCHSPEHTELRKPIQDLTAIAEAAGRPSRQRTTLYGEVPAERITAGLASDGHLPQLLPVINTEALHTTDPHGTTGAATSAGAGPVGRHR